MLASASLGFLFLSRPVADASGEERRGHRQIDGWHEIAEWTLVITIGIHVAAALAHIFIYRDRIIQRMLPSRW